MGMQGARAVIAGLAFATVLALAGCTAPGPGADPAVGSTGAPRSVPSTVAPSGEVEPVLRAELPAAENLAYFDSVNLAVIAGDPSPSGRAFIDALVDAGFDRAAMQVTSDTTTLGEPADSIQFAVGIGPDCLVGQFGPKSDGYHSAVRPALGTGGCLVGATRPIDW